MKQDAFEDQAKKQIQLIDEVLNGLSSNGVHVSLPSVGVYNLLKKQRKEILHMQQITHLLHVIFSYKRSVQSYVGNQMK